ncbi:COG4 transport protein-domain-containing protein [Diplogelasinospora grovesii]|uniref:COG4 transport protein-domain-containing protein n=1 Tax=Diplogelasinospora grovesii TaxID=303347 RepID=A0AAN6S3T8_9PEZI|nr:COG4 transport protein-domain-containing protein [Diplogelasinospora grovesii]
MRDSNQHNVWSLVGGHECRLNQHYGTGKMVRVIERLQIEADSDERNVDRKLTDIKSYPFSFLVQSLLLPQRGFGGTPRVNSPALGNSNDDTQNSEDEGVNIKEVDGLLSEIAVMLGQWSFYSRFLARTYRVPSHDILWLEGTCRSPNLSPDAPLVIPDVLIKSNLSQKVFTKLTTPYNIMMTFFFRRSVEKAFQLNESPSGLASPPYIISAVDDVMYIVNAPSGGVIDQVIPIISSVLGSNFVGMIQRKMGDESSPRAIVQGRFPPEDKIIAFIVLINSLDMANEGAAATANGTAITTASVPPSLRDSFPFQNDIKEVATRLRSLYSSFSSKATELLNEGLQVLFNQVIKPRLRPLLTDTFCDVNYTLSEEELVELAAQRDEEEDKIRELAARRFEHGGDTLMRPIARTFAIVLNVAARHLAHVLEKRVLGYTGRTTAYGVIRMERDFGSIVAAVSKGGHHAVREVFSKTTQLLMVANMDDEEWEELEAGDGIVWALSKDEMVKARNLVRE